MYVCCVCVYEQNTIFVDKNNLELVYINVYVWWVTDDQAIFATFQHFVYLTV